METVVQIIWWLGLAGALVMTGVVLKLVFLVVRTLGDILKLAGITRTAAAGIREHGAGAARIEAAGPPALRLRDAADELARASASLRSGLAGPGTPSQRGGTPG